MTFELDFKFFILRVQAPALRTERHLDWLYALHKPIEQLYDEFMLYRQRILKEISYNGQTIVLEYSLNEKWPLAGGNIYIDNTIDNVEPVFIYDLSENEQPTYTYDISEGEDDPFINDISEFGQSYDFIVYVPDTLVFDEDEMKSFVKKYKIAGPRFIIKTYTV